MLWIADREYEELTGGDNEGKKGCPLLDLEVWLQ